ncbi:MAG TPA: FHA domain-containing protein, partial [Archangium sp.]|nr:FHA domain-containing protein [Archangium sp.]
MPELVFFRRGEEVLRVGLGRERMVLGRGEKSDVVIPDPEVSRQQVALVFDGQRCTLEDLSGKGTQVAGASMKKGELADGSDLTLGQWRAVFRLHGSGQSDATTEVGNHTELQPRDSVSRWQPAQVRIRQGSHETVQKLTGDSFTVGKDASCDLVIQDSFIS